MWMEVSSLCSNISSSDLFSDKNEDSKILSGSSGLLGLKYAFKDADQKNLSMLSFNFP